MPRRGVTVIKKKEKSMKDRNPPSKPEWLNVQQVAELIGCASRTVWKLSSKGDFPAPVRITPRMPRWSRAEIEAHLAALVNSKR